MSIGSALGDIRVIDASTLFAGPTVASMLSDMGADVVKVEHPNRPDSSRGHGASKGTVGLWWKMIGRNKRNIAIDLHNDDGQEVFLKLVESADILVENFRPGKLASWGLSYERMAEINPGLIVVRITGFGQVGPRSHEPGFGTLAEAMSGFASMTGEPDGPPTLPPLALADSIAGITGAYAALAALHARSINGGLGQEIDLSLVEPMMSVLGPQITAYDQLGIVAERHGNRSVNNAPRNLYQAADGKWIAISTSSQSIAERVMMMVGRADYVEQPWFQSGAERAKHADELDDAINAWLKDKDSTEALEAFRQAQAAATLVYDVSDLINDPQLAALNAIQSVQDPELGELKMQNVPFRMSRTPGEIRWAGKPHASDTDQILSELGYSEEEVEALKQTGEVK